MQNTGNLNSLAERMKDRTERERQELEALTRQQFSALSQSLSESSKNALCTTEAAILSGIAEMEKNITSRCQSLGEMFNRKYLLSIVLSAGILAATMFTCWSLITLYRHQIADLRQEVTKLSARKVEMETTIAAWPITVRDAPNGRFIVPTPPHTLKDKWTFDGQSAWKLE